MRTCVDGNVFEQYAHPIEGPASAGSDNGSGAVASRYAKEIVKLRKSRGLSKYALAKETGLSKQVIGKVEADLGGPDLRVFMTLAEYFGSDPIVLWRKLPPERREA